MKAWKVICIYEWMTLMHADTRGKAINAARNNIYSDDFINFRALRVPALDDRPFTWENVDAAEVGYVDADDLPLQKNEYFNDCPCPICKGVVP